MLKTHFDHHIADDQIPSRFQSGCEGNGGVVVAWKHLKYLDNWSAPLVINFNIKKLCLTV